MPPVFHRSGDDFEWMDRSKFISLLATLSSCWDVLEIDTLRVYSIILFARAVKANGDRKVTSIEIHPARRKFAIGNRLYVGVKVPEEAELLVGATYSSN